MTTKERNYAVTKTCPVCEAEHTVKVNEDDLRVYNSPERPYIQDIFPYLTAAEREVLMTGIDDDCFKKLFPPEDDE